MLSRGILATASLLVGTAAQAQVRNCTVPPFRTVDGGTIEVKITVRSGKTCWFRLGNSLAAISEARVVTKPSVGTAAPQGTSVSYSAKAGFAGTDQFSWAWAGRTRWGRDTTWPVDVLVTVIP